MRKATAAAMVQSAFTAPHVTEWVTCDVTATMELVERSEPRREFADVKISPLLIVAKAVCLALKRNPGAQLGLGRGGPGDRAQGARSTWASPRPPRAD